MLAEKRGEGPKVRRSIQMKQRKQMKCYMKGDWKTQRKRGTGSSTNRKQKHLLMSKGKEGDLQNNLKKNYEKN